MSGQQTVLSEQQQNTMASVNLARLAIREARATHPVVHKVLEMCEHGGLPFDDACILLAGHLIQQNDALLTQVLDAHNQHLRPYIMVCSEAERDAMLTLLHVKAL